MRPNCHVDIKALAFEDEREVGTREHLTRVLGQKHSFVWFVLIALFIAGMWYFVPWAKPSTWSVAMNVALTGMMAGLAANAWVKYLRDGVRRAIGKPDCARVLPARIVRFKLDDGGGRFVTVDGRRVYQSYGGSSRSATPYVTLTLEAHDGQRTLTWTEYVDPWPWGQLFTNDSEVVPTRVEAFGPSSKELHLPIPVLALVWPNEPRGWLVGVHKDVLAHSEVLRAHAAPAA